MNEELTTVNQENRHRVEELSALTNDLENLLAATDVATLFLDRKLRIIWFTPQVAQLFNVRNTDKGRPVSDLTHRLADAQLEEDAKRVLDKLQPVEREVGSDAGLWYLTRVLPYRATEDQIKGVVITFIDITERKQAEQAVRAARDRLEERVVERTSELEQQKHRLRNLTRELAAAENRERKRLAALLHDELQQYLVALKMEMERVEPAAGASAVSALLDRSNHLIDRAIDASRHLTRELRPPVLYESGLPAAVRWLASEMAERHHLEVSVDAGVPSMDEDMRAMLFETVRELLFNVVKHAGVQQAGVAIRAREERLRIIVSDHGNGFDAEAVRSGDHEPGGLGLFSIRERLQAIGGRLEIRSIPDDGSEIIVEVPMEVASKAKPSNPPASSSSGAKSSAGTIQRTAGAGPGVLVVDDHAIMRDGLVKLIGTDERVHIVGEAADGQEAIEAVERLQPDVVLMDVNLPIVNGIDATRRIREQWPDVQVVGLSVQDDPATHQSMLEAGASAFISKSEKAETMVATVLRVCQTE
jgi:two-component system CheB/CheR fusion protein